MVPVVVLQSLPLPYPVSVALLTAALRKNLGNSMLCTARSGIAQRFVSRLLPDNVYSLKNFTISLNKDMFRVHNSDSHIITLEGNTIVKPIDCRVDGFIRYPFELVEFEDVVCNGSKFLVDVIGSLSNTTSPKVTPNGTKFMDCHIMNERCVVVVMYLLILVSFFCLQSTLLAFWCFVFEQNLRLLLYLIK